MEKEIKISVVNSLDDYQKVIAIRSIVFVGEQKQLYAAMIFFVFTLESSGYLDFVSVIQIHAHEYLRENNRNTICRPACSL